MNNVAEAASRMCNRVSLIVQAGLEAHQHIEWEEATSPVKEVSKAVGLDPLGIPIEQLASTLISWTIFGADPVDGSQTQLQESALERIDDSDARIVYRQVRLETMRAWRYTRHSAGRDVAHQIGGPERSREELFDGCISAETGELVGSGCYLGWPVNSEGHHWLLVACELSAESVESIGNIIPFPKPDDAVEFWREHRHEAIALAVDPPKLIRLGDESEERELDPGAFRNGAKLVVHPVSSSADLLDRVVQCANFDLETSRKSGYHLRLRRVRWAREIIASARNAERLESLIAAFAKLRWRLLGWSVQRRFKGQDDPTLESWLSMERILAGFGTNSNAEMSGADLSGLRNHPIGILLLPDDHVIYQDLHPREPIRSGLQWARDHGDEEIPAIFEVYRTERRWVATLDPVDLSVEEHLARIDYAEVIHAMQKGPFDPLVNETHLDSIAIEPRHMNRLEAALRPKPWTEDNRLTVADLPRDEPAFLRMRNVGEGALDQVKNALLQLADGWRAQRMGVDPRELATRQAGAGASSEDLENGLGALADLFGEEESGEN